MEHQFLLYKSLAQTDLALSKPDPLPESPTWAGDPKLGVLEVAVGGPMEWLQIVPFLGRRQIVVGSIYSYYEFTSREVYDNARWRKRDPCASAPSVDPGACHAARGSCRTVASH